jgi:nucleoside-diphosphate-sugar epimerase
MTTHLVIGAGPVGRATARHLAARGHDVVLASRTAGATGIDGVQPCRVDALDTEALARAAAGATSVVNAANPPYHAWATMWPPLAASILEVACRVEARLVTMSNLYGYRIDGPLREDTPLDPTHAKGLIRTRMWEDALAAQRAGRLPAASEARASDFFGPEVRSSTVAFAMPALLAGKTARVIGRADQPHSVTYIDDVGRTLAVLATDPAGDGRVWHVPTAAARTQGELLRDLAAAAGAPNPRIATVSRRMLRALGIVSRDMREMQHVYDQFDRPFVIDSSAFTHTFGIEPAPWEDAVATTVEWWRRQDASTRTAA